MLSCSEKAHKSETAILQVKSSQDIGSVKFGDTLTKHITFKNTSPNNLIIKKIESSCGCTLVNFKDSIIRPNSTSEIKVNFTPKIGNKGVITESVIIDANTNPNFTVIYLNGTVID